MVHVRFLMYMCSTREVSTVYVDVNICGTCEVSYMYVSLCDICVRFRISYLFIMWYFLVF